MKTTKILLVLGIIALSLSSCKKDKDDDNPFKASYSDLSSEENKANIEDNGIALVNEIEQLKNATAVEVATHFVELIYLHRSRMPKVKKF
jgi:hypothetical protein